MPEAERRDGLGVIPGWKVAQVLDDYFAGWEAVHPMATDEEFDVTFAELVGNVVETNEIGCQTGTDDVFLQTALSGKEAAPGRAPPLERALPIGTHRPYPATGRAFAR